MDLIVVDLFLICTISADLVFTKYFIIISFFFIVVLIIHVFVYDVLAVRLVLHRSIVDSAGRLSAGRGGFGGGATCSNVLFIVPQLVVSALTRRSSS